MNRKNQHAAAVRTVRCAGCNCSSGIFWNRWRAHRIDTPESGETQALAFYCPACADREFGDRFRPA